MTQTELNANMDADKVNSLSTSALKVMPDALKTAIKNNPTLSAGLEPSQQSAIGLLDKSVSTTVVASSAYSISCNLVVLILTIFSILKI